MKDKNILDCFANTKNLHSMGPVVLPSGNLGPINIDLVKVFSNPKRLTIIGRALAKKIRNKEISLLVGIPTAGLPLVASVSYWSGLPFVYVRQKPDPRTGEVIQGEYQRGQKAALVDDVIGSGVTKKKVLAQIKNELKIKDILVVMDVDKHYYPNYRSWTKRRKIQVQAFFSWTKLTKYLVQMNALDKQAGKFLLLYLKNPKWSKKPKLWKRYQQWKKSTGLKTGEPLR